MKISIIEKDSKGVVKNHSIVYSLHPRAVQLLKANLEKGIVNVIEPTIVRYPEDPPPNGQVYWCPYCAVYVKFKTLPGFRGYKGCSICGVSDKDYSVKKINKLKE